jgi:hypothetical protein
MWEGIDLKEHANSGDLEGYRIVENQEYNSTYSLVDDTAEHELLEEMIEESKPPKPGDCSFDDYLLFTPFRYPPLKDATRFGKVTERSPFYGSEKLDAAFAEKAYRIEKFDSDTKAIFPNRNLSFTSFKFFANAKRYLNVLKVPFDKYKTRIHDPVNYSDSQDLGTEMRECEIQACLFESVRCSDIKNIAIFDPSIFTNKSQDKKQWSCLIGHAEITFIQGREKKYSYKRSS